MATVLLEDVNVGDQLPEFVGPVVTRHVLSMFCGASADYSPMHVDIDFVKQFGMKDVFVNGMLSMAYLAQLLTRWVPQSQLRKWGVRFLAITPLHVRVTCTGIITGKFEAEGERRVRLQINTYTDAGAHTLSGEAVIALF